MDCSLKGKVALITGASAHRHSIAIGMAEAGADLAIAAGRFPTWKKWRRR